MDRITELRDLLTEEIQRIQKGETTATNVNSIVNASGKVIASIRLQMDYEKLCGRTPKIKFMEDQ